MALHPFSHYPLISVPVTLTILSFRFVFLSLLADSLSGILEVISFNDKIRCSGMLRHVVTDVSGQLTSPVQGSSCWKKNCVMMHLIYWHAISMGKALNPYIIDQQISVELCSYLADDVHSHRLQERALSSGSYGATARCGRRGLNCGTPLSYQLPLDVDYLFLLSWA
jgi:hypothetical protein